MSMISYSRKGSGEPVLLVHGIGHQRSAWGETFDLLAEDFDVIAVDLPGFGESVKPVRPAGYSMTSYADQLIALCRSIGVDRPHVVGNSLGGLIALEMAANGSVSSVTALSPAGFYSKPELAWIGSNLVVLRTCSHAPYKVVKLFAERLSLRKITMRCLYEKPDRLTAEQALADTLNLRDSPGFWPCFVGGVTHDFKRIPIVPTTVAWGDKDRLLLPHQAERAKDRMPEVEHVPLPGCGHVPMLDDPQLVVDVIRSTIARARATTTAVAV